MKKLVLLLGLALAGAAAAAGLAGRTGAAVRPADIPTYTSTAIPVYTSTGVTNTAPKQTTRPASWFVGLWGTWVPGGTWEGAGYIWFSTGAKGKALRVDANHTWAWHGLRGRWRNGDSEYPIVLLHALDGHDWKVGTAPSYVRAAQITIWDGYTYYYGKRARR